MKKDVDGLGDLSPIDLALLEYLNEKAPFVSMMIEGDWGAGKTHYLRTRGSRIAARANKRCISFSVAGLESRSDLERALFFASAPILDNGYAEALGVFTRAAMRWVNIEPSELKLKADISSEKVVVFVDDIERFAGDQRIILGFVIDLVDNNGIHVVVVSSEKKLLSSSSYLGEWKEKVVGRTVRLNPSPEDMVDAALTEIASKFAADRLKALRNSLVGVVSKSDLKSFRAVKHSIREIGKVIELIGDSYDGMNYKKEVLVEGILVGLLEIKRNASCTLRIADLFSHSDLRVAYEAVTSKGLDSSGNKNEKDFVEIIFDRYAGTEIINFNGGLVFYNFYANGIFDAKLLIDGFMEISSAREDVKSAGEVDGMSVLSFSAFDFSQAEFDAQFDYIKGRLSGSEFRSVSAVVRIYVSMRYWAQRRIISMSPDDVAKLCISAIDGIPAGELLDPSADTDVFWFQKQMDDSDVDVEEAVRKKIAESMEDSLSKQRQAVRRWLDGDSDSVVDLKSEWLLAPLFVDEVEEWISAFRSASPARIQEVLRLLSARSRVAGVGSNLRQEVSLLSAIATGVEKGLPTEGDLSLMQSQLIELATMLRSLDSNVAAFLEMERNFPGTDAGNAEQ
ncbi:P-loop NTPase fold protein [Pseudoxanthomonas sp. PXM02]|uniref:P-loop NTPase fold protein n=1 Tax=Pseudoxanthomonas sp. PXM02 TaxID=2769294 RepID=UPI00177F9A3D|nr:P-loop NTPase fold protein [Pseudoxanthomonas sp. PXM02]MBD9477689.1 hypothetical protein [Pseudoxanthomonas sp. PXM02]